MRWNWWSGCWIRKVRLLNIKETIEIIGLVLFHDLLVYVQSWLDNIWCFLLTIFFIVIQKIFIFRYFWALLLSLIRKVRRSWLLEIIREWLSSEITPVITLHFCVGFFLCIGTPNINFKRFSRCVKLRRVSFEVWNLFFVFFKLTVSFLLVVEMRKYFVIYSEFECLPLLNAVQGEPIKREGILEWNIRG